MSARSTDPNGPATLDDLYAAEDWLSTYEVDDDSDESDRAIKAQLDRVRRYLRAEMRRREVDAAARQVRASLLADPSVTVKPTLARVAAMPAVQALVALQVDDPDAPGARS